MKPKTRSLLFLMSFALCALLYHQLEINDTPMEPVKSVDFTTIEIIDLENDLTNEATTENDIE